MDLSAQISYQGCLIGVQKYDFTNDGGQRVKGLSLHVSSPIPSDQGVGFTSQKLGYKGAFEDFPRLSGLVGHQVLISMGKNNSALDVQKIGSAK